MSAHRSEEIPRRAWITLSILGLSLMITMYGETMLLPAIPDIIKEFKITYDTSSWILSSYLIAGAVSTPIAGRLSDIYGRKKMVVAIMIIYIIGIALGGFSQNIGFLVFARVVQGIGISMFPIAFGIIRDQIPEKKLAVGVGVFSSMFAAGSVVGLAIGSTIIENFGWRATFFSIVFVAVGLWFVIRRVIQDRQPSVELVSLPKSNNLFDSLDKKARRMFEGNVSSIDIKGSVTLAVTVTSFLLVLSYSQTTATQNFLVPVFLFLGSISLLLFLLIEKRSDAPLVNLHLMTDKVIISANLLLVISFFCMFTVFQTIPVLVRSPIPLGFGGNAITSANIQLPFMIVFLLFAPSSGFIISKMGNMRPTILGSLITAMGFFSLFIFHSTASMISANLAIIAAGLSLMQVGGFNIVLQSTPMQFSGISLGMTVLFNLIGGSIGPAIAGIYMQSGQVISSITGNYFPSPESYSLIFLTTALVSLISVVLAFFIRSKQPRIIAV